MTALRYVARIFPTPQVIALTTTQVLRTQAERLEEIDRVTDQLVEMGKCRLRSDVSREAEWKAASLLGVWR